MATKQAQRGELPFDIVTELVKHLIDDEAYRTATNTILNN
jgi:hypothetical protein